MHALLRLRLCMLLAVHLGAQQQLLQMRHAPLLARHLVVDAHEKSFSTSYTPYNASLPRSNAAFASMPRMMSEQPRMRCTDNERPW